ncbi:hypothetical protein IFHNHDMJ_00631 [Synechococcus sp. CBW1107]|nr:hypothetical protein IFHNHDMJ_00631 [Synechococcus sp. CBW1107]
MSKSKENQHFQGGLPVTGLYDHQGVLRVSGDLEDCLAYAELFGFEVESFSLVSLVGELPVRSHPANSN